MPNNPGKGSGKWSGTLVRRVLRQGIEAGKSGNRTLATVCATAPQSPGRQKDPGGHRCWIIDSKASLSGTESNFETCLRPYPQLMLICKLAILFVS